MREITIKNEEAPCKWWAAKDARMRNYANKSHYDAAMHLRVNRMKGVLEVLYLARGVYEAYGKQGVSIKIDHGRVRDARTLAKLESEWSAQGVVKKVTPQGIIYRIA